MFFQKKWPDLGKTFSSFSIWGFGKPGNLSETLRDLSETSRRPLGNLSEPLGNLSETSWRPKSLKVVGGVEYQLHTNFRKVSERFREVSERSLRGSESEVSKRSPRGFREVSERFPRGLREVSERSLRGSERFPRGLREVSERFPRGSERFPRGLREACERSPRGFREVSERFREVSKRSPRGFRGVSARFGYWNVQFTSMLSIYIAKNFPIGKTCRGPNREVCRQLCQRYYATDNRPAICAEWFANGFSHNLSSKNRVFDHKSKNQCSYYTATINLFQMLIKNKYMKFINYININIS